MCMASRSSAPAPAPLAPPDPSIARREEEQSSEKMANQAKDVKKRKNTAYAMGGSSSLINSTGAGFLGAGQSPTLGA